LSRVRIGTGHGDGAERPKTPLSGLLRKKQRTARSGEEGGIGAGGGARRVVHRAADSSVRQNDMAYGATR